MQIFRDTIRVDRDNIGKELQFNRGCVNDEIIKYYMFYFEENENKFDTLHYSILKLELLTADTKLELVNFIKKNFN